MAAVVLWSSSCGNDTDRVPPEIEEETVSLPFRLCSYHFHKNTISRYEWNGQGIVVVFANAGPEKGDLKYIAEYRNGLLHGRYVAFDDQSISVEGYMSHGEPSGKWRRWQKYAVPKPIPVEKTADVTTTEGLSILKGAVKEEKNYSTSTMTVRDLNTGVRFMYLFSETGRGIDLGFANDGELRSFETIVQSDQGFPISEGWGILWGDYARSEKGMIETVSFSEGGRWEGVTQFMAYGTTPDYSIGYYVSGRRVVFIDFHEDSSIVTFTKYDVNERVVERHYYGMGERRFSEDLLPIEHANSDESESENRKN